MARRHGRNGRLYLGIASSAAVPSPLALLAKWQANFATDKQEATAFGDANKIRVTGLPDAQGSYSGFFDDATAQTYTAAVDGNSRMFYLYPDVTNAPTVYWYGTGFFDFEASGGVEEVISFSGSWVAAGPISKNG